MAITTPISPPMNTASNLPYHTSRTHRSALSDIRVRLSLFLDEINPGRPSTLYALFLSWYSSNGVRVYSHSTRTNVVLLFVSILIPIY